MCIRDRLYGGDEGADAAAQLYVALNNAVLDSVPRGMTVNTHVCRGNFHSTWAASGGYAPVSKILFQQERVDGYYLEFDDERSGGFEPLADLAEGKIVVLGLITSKRPQLEEKPVSYTHLRPFYPQWDEALYQQLRAEFELPDRKIKELSKGQQKILSFLMAFCCRPRLLILDEPTANLDPAVRHRLLGYLRRYMEEEGNTILYSTHITADLEDICDYLVGLDHGVLAFQGEKDEVLDAFRVVQGLSLIHI